MFRVLTQIMSSFYAVKQGRVAGVYTTWQECAKQVQGFQNAVFKKFPTKHEAEAFVRGGGKTEITATVFPGAARQPPKKCTCVCTCGASETKLPTKRQNSLLMHTEALPLPPRKKFKPSGPPVGTDADGRVTIYTDGACEKNGKKDSTGGIGVYWGPKHPLNVSEPLTGRQTNNRAEIMVLAAARAIEQAKSVGITKVRICTDSKFLISAITQWVKKWLRNGWKLSTGGDVINREDFEHLLLVSKNMDVQWEKVKAHRGIFENEEADKLARDGVK